MDPIISASGLAELLAGPARPVLLDVRWQLGGPPGWPQYEHGHIPGAHYIDLDTELAGPPGVNGRHPLPDRSVFQAALRRAGVRTDRGVVVYDGGDSMPAARAWWLLRWAGHRGVRVLDGGLPAWTASGRPTQTEVPAAEQGDFTVTPGGLPVLSADDAAELAMSGLLLDARAAERYRGEVEPIDPVAGHIPGAVSAPTAENMTTQGFFRTPEELRERFAALGLSDPRVPNARRVGVYCGSGVSAAQQALAIELAFGAPVEVSLYVGSWSEWTASHGGRPVATGPDPR